MPDSHPGRGCLLARSLFSRVDAFYPALVGNDIGCGMALWQTDILGRVITPINWSSGFRRRCLTWRTRSGWRRMSPPQCSIIRGASALGSIGGGNHFAELQQVDHRRC